MSSQILKIIAAMMLIGSFILIIIAYRLSKPPQPTEPTASAVKTPERTYQIVTAAHTISKGDIIHENDVVLSTISERPADAFDATTEILGKRTINPIAQGKPILRSDFATGNPIAYSLKPNERAIAIKVSEVIGVGGFIQPGDTVDVIAFIRKDTETVSENQAVVMLHDVRILSYGEEALAATSDKPTSKDEPAKSKTGKNTAVIAVDAEQTALVTLVENLGVLRLALRPASADGSERPSSPTTLSDIAAPPATQSLVPEKPQGPIVEIYHGTHVEQVQYP